MNHKQILLALQDHYLFDKYLYELLTERGKRHCFEHMKI